MKIKEDEAPSNSLSAASMSADDVQLPMSKIMKRKVPPLQFARIMNKKTTAEDDKMLSELKESVASDHKILITTQCVSYSIEV